MIERFFEGRNAAFALTVRMKRTRRVFRWTCLLTLLGFCTLFLCARTAYPGMLGIGEDAFFELGFLGLCCGAIVFIGSDFGVVFIEATFKDELFRLTPLKPMDFVYGGMLSSLFFCTIFLALSLPFVLLGFLLHYPMLRVCCGLVLLFLAGQTLSTVLLSFYVKAKQWSEIAPAVTCMLLLFLAFPFFCMSRFGLKLTSAQYWHEPMMFLFAFLVTLFTLAFVLARCHARTLNTGFRKAVTINGLCYTIHAALAIATVFILSR